MLLVASGAGAQSAQPAAKPDAPAAKGGTTLYKWVDESGVVHYSDQPHSGADKIQVHKAQTYPGQRAAPRSSSATKPPSTGRYERFLLTSPQDGDVFVNTGGAIPIAVDLEPGLAPEHSLWFLLDGEHVDGLAPEATEGTLSALDRGTHTLVAQVVDARGTVVVYTDPVSFVVRQPSSIRNGANAHP